MNEQKNPTTIDNSFMFIPTRIVRINNFSIATQYVENIIIAVEKLANTLL